MSFHHFKIILFNHQHTVVSYGITKTISITPCSNTRITLNSLVRCTQFYIEAHTQCTVHSQSVYVCCVYFSLMHCVVCMKEQNTSFLEAVTVIGSCWWHSRAASQPSTKLNLTTQENRTEQNRTAMRCTVLSMESESNVWLD